MKAMREAVTRTTSPSADGPHRTRKAAEERTPVDYISAAFRSRAMTVFLALVLLQGFHELEHVTQVLQRYLLGIPDGNGLLGSLADVEPLHFA